MRAVQFRGAVSIAFCLLSACAAAVIEYVVAVAPGQPFVGVTVTAPVEGGEIRFQIPAWTPGAYVLRNYHEAITEVTARGGSGSVLSVEKEDHLTWVVRSRGESRVHLSYRVRREAVSPDGVQIGGTSTYLYVVGRKHERCRVRFEIPRGWRVAIGLDPLGTDTFHAANYDVLADSPAQLGHFKVDEFKVKGVPHQCVVFGKGAEQVDLRRLVSICRRIVEVQTAFFGDIPYKRYVFLFHVDPGTDGAGGLEHRNSTSIWMGPDLGPRAIHVIAHEFFHLWNVKRIRPEILGPFDYTAAAPTRNLWWCEGVTDYYTTMLNYRAGFLTIEDFYAVWQRDIERLQKEPARLKVSADECSFRTWEAGTHWGFGGLNYYLKGKLVGLCLDLKLRDLTDGRGSLDHVMRLLYERCGRGDGPGFPEDGIRDACIAIGGPAMGSFYDKVARSTEELPLAEVFASIGVRCSIRSVGGSEEISVRVEPMKETTRRQERLRDGWLRGSLPISTSRVESRGLLTSRSRLAVATTL